VTKRHDSHGQAVGTKNRQPASRSGVTFPQLVNETFPQLNQLSYRLNVAVTTSNFPFPTPPSSTRDSSQHAVHNLQDLLILSRPDLFQNFQSQIGISINLHVSHPQQVGWDFWNHLGFVDWSRKFQSDFELHLWCYHNRGLYLGYERGKRCEFSESLEGLLRKDSAPSRPRYL
jgi:hypothetical protein